MTSIHERLSRYRRAARDTFNAHFLPYVETERDYEVFASVDSVMLQVLVLDHIGVQAPPDYRAIPELVLRVRRPSTEGAVQGSTPETASFNEDWRFGFMQFIDFEEDWSAKELDWVSVQVLSGPEPRLFGARVVFRWHDLVVLEPTSEAV